MKSFSAVVLLAVTFLCPDDVLAQRPVTHTATPIGGTATATAAPSILGGILDRISALEAQVAGLQAALAAETAARQVAVAVEAAARQNADAMLTASIMEFRRHI